MTNLTIVQKNKARLKYALQISILVGYKLHHRARRKRIISNESHFSCEKTVNLARYCDRKLRIPPRSESPDKNYANKHWYSVPAKTEAQLKDKRDEIAH
jgi:hypothetical protein